MTPAELLGLQLNDLGISYTREHKFHPTRRWRFDYAWPDLKFAVEVEGGLYVFGRHSRGAGFEKDLEKYKEAMLLGWTVFRVGSSLIKSGEALSVIKIMLERITGQTSQS